MDTQENVVVLPKWYESTQGPETSATIKALTLHIVPLVNMVLISKGVVIPGLSETIDTVITIAVFLWCSVQAAAGYVRAKKVMGSQIERLKKQNDELGAMLNPGGRR